MSEVGLEYQPVDLQMTRHDLAASPEFVRERTHLWSSILHDQPISAAWIQAAMDGLEF